MHSKSAMIQIYFLKKYLGKIIKIISSNFFICGNFDKGKKLYKYPLVPFLLADKQDLKKIKAQPYAI
ncbi:hypothetical protein BpHYR1_000619 [Brachionus plicatilis]|uniref:Uncharacterized protein n=1 Tax=Brachionus plicatilis TaxID=10195 RepID=A0A3M7R6E1_BRAPC|nr:hypothetical protein BpHYR1_000619 [Brachionus plicatilis]